MLIFQSLYPPKLIFPQQIEQILPLLLSPVNVISSKFPEFKLQRIGHTNRQRIFLTNTIGGAGLTLISLLGPSNSAAAAAAAISFIEPSNALSVTTWAVHVAIVVEWATAMALVWQYGENSGIQSWKGLSWGMVPLLGVAICACTWHFFYNAESLEVLLILQAAMTVIGNSTMCIAAYRIYMSSEERFKNF